MSYSHPTQFTCPNCQAPFEAGVWLIVDASERPDLIEALLQGRLHDLACPACGHTGQVDAPLLLYRPAEAPVLVFSPARATATPEAARLQADGLLAALRGSLRDVWQDRWLEDMPVLPRDLLPTLLKDGPEAAARQLDARQAPPAPSVPPEVQVLLAALQSLPPEQRRLAQLDLAQAATPEAFAAVIDRHPALREAVKKVLEDGEP